MISIYYINIILLIYYINILANLRYGPVSQNQIKLHSKLKRISSGDQSVLALQISPRLGLIHV